MCVSFEGQLRHLRDLREEDVDQCALESRSCPVKSVATEDSDPLSYPYSLSVESYSDKDKTKQHMLLRSIAQTQDKVNKQRGGR